MSIANSIQHGSLGQVAYRCKRTQAAMQVGLIALFVALLSMWCCLCQYGGRLFLQYRAGRSRLTVITLGFDRLHIAYDNIDKIMFCDILFPCSWRWRDSVHEFNYFSSRILCNRVWGTMAVIKTLRGSPEYVVISPSSPEKLLEKYYASDYGPDLP